MKSTRVIRDFWRQLFCELIEQGTDMTYISLQSIIAILDDCNELEDLASGSKSSSRIESH